MIDPQTAQTSPTNRTTQSGKSSLVVQFVEGVFVDSYYPTIETTFTKPIKYKGAEYECDILDTAGQVGLRYIQAILLHWIQDEYSLINSKHAIGIHGYMLVFSLASRASFEMVATVHDKLLAYHGLEALPVVVIGQKSDLVQQRWVARRTTAAQLTPSQRRRQRGSRANVQAAQRFIRRSLRRCERERRCVMTSPRLRHTHSPHSQGIRVHACRDRI